MKNRAIFYLIFSFFIIISLFTACKKESGPTTVNGTVKDVTTNVGVSNAEVGLFETDGESAFGLGGVLMEEKYSDASGEFIFNFDAREGYQYYVQAIKELYFNDQSNNVTFVDELGSSGNITVYLQPEANLQVHIQTVNEYDPSDHISVNGTEEGSFYGNDVDTIILIKSQGNQTHQLAWFIYYDDAIENHVAYIYVPAFDTSYYEILY